MAPSLQTQKPIDLQSLRDAVLGTERRPYFSIQVGLTDTDQRELVDFDEGRQDGLERPEHDVADRQRGAESPEDGEQDAPKSSPVCSVVSLLRSSLEG